MKIKKYTLSKDRKGLLAWFDPDTGKGYYHIHSNEMTLFQRWIHFQKSVGEMEAGFQFGVMFSWNQFKGVSLRFGEHSLYLGIINENTNCR